MSDETVIRSSSLTPYTACNRRGAANMFRREIIAMGFELRHTSNSIAAAIGTGVHGGAAAMLEVKQQTGDLPAESVGVEAAVETLRDRVKEEETSYDKTTPEFGTAQRQVIRMTERYQRDIASEIDPIVIEERLEARVPGSKCNLILSGQGDVLAREPHRVRDTKTGARIGNHGAQLGSYALLYRTDRYDVTSASIDFIQRVSIKKDQPPARKFEYNLDRIETAAIAILKHIDQDLYTFRNGDPERGILPGDPWIFQAAPSCYLCSAAYCAAYGIKGENAFCTEWDKGEEIE